MGKMGGRELNYHSDLDIIYVYDYQGMTNGERRISNREYFAKLGQKIYLDPLHAHAGRARLHHRHAAPPVWERRAAGHLAGVVPDLPPEEAHVWERQALTKARVVLGDGMLREEIEEVIRDTVYGAGADDEVRREIHRLRMRMEHELARESLGSYNIKTGRGGMVDVEFIVPVSPAAARQGLSPGQECRTLEALQALHACSLVSDEDFQALSDGYTFLRILENRLRIIHDYSMNQLGGPKGYLNKLAVAWGTTRGSAIPAMRSWADYERITGSVRRAYDRILARGRCRPPPDGFTQRPVPLSGLPQPPSRYGRPV
jgi:glutamate-ammonia-ligase adenylyltransferase